MDTPRPSLPGTAVHPELSTTSPAGAPTPAPDDGSAVIDMLNQKPEVYRRGLEATLEALPNQRERILRSLETPQLGGFHCEGERMESHIRLMVATMENVRTGAFPDVIDPETRTMLRSVICTEDPERPGEQLVDPRMQMYAFVHDIAKPERMRLKFDEGKAVNITWDEWKAIEARGKPYSSLAEDGMPRGIKSISYRQDGVERGEHGEAGADMLRGESAIPNDVRIAVEHHEDCFDYRERVNTALFHEKFTKRGFSDAQQRLIIAATYVDQMSSLREGGKPETTTFNNLCTSYRNEKLLLEVTGKGKYRPDDINALRNLPKPLTEAMIRAKEMVEKRYDATLLQAELAALEYAPNPKKPTELVRLEAAQVESIVTTAVNEPGALGSKYGSLMRFIKPILAKAEVKG